MSRQAAMSSSASRTSAGERWPLAPLMMRIELREASSTKIGATPLEASVASTWVVSMPLRAKLSTVLAAKTSLRPG